jgi:hypothetical protein
MPYLGGGGVGLLLLSLHFSGGSSPRPPILSEWEYFAHDVGRFVSILVGLQKYSFPLCFAFHDRENMSEFCLVVKHLVENQTHELVGAK